MTQGQLDLDVVVGLLHNGSAFSWLDDPHLPEREAATGRRAVSWTRDPHLADNLGDDRAMSRYPYQDGRLR